VYTKQKTQRKWLTLFRNKYGTAFMKNFCPCLGKPQCAFAASDRKTQRIEKSITSFSLENRPVAKTISPNKGSLK
jgi:hypothetical protein